MSSHYGKQRSLFKEKVCLTWGWCVVRNRKLFEFQVIVCREGIHEVNSDCFINFCTPNILSGNDFFARVHEIAGPDLANECQKFLGMCPTSSRATSSYKAENFKCLN
jgi:hypothetical protein